MFSDGDDALFMIDDPKSTTKPVAKDDDDLFGFQPNHQVVANNDVDDDDLFGFQPKPIQSKPTQLKPTQAKSTQPEVIRPDDRKRKELDEDDLFGFGTPSPVKKPRMQISKESAKIAENAGTTVGNGANSTQTNKNESAERALSSSLKSTADTSKAASTPFTRPGKGCPKRINMA